MCVHSQYFGSLMVIFCVELASGVWTYDEVCGAMNKQKCLLSSLSHVNNTAATWPFPGENGMRIRFLNRLLTV